MGEAAASKAACRAASGAASGTATGEAAASGAAPGQAMGQTATGQAERGQAMGQVRNRPAICGERERRAVISAPAHTIAGFAIGVIAIRLDYPKLPGNVVNAATFHFPVLYEEVDFEIERLFDGDPTLVEVVVAAARRLEAAGVRAIVGACGFFAHFQDAVACAVDVPVFLSSLVQVPLIEVGLKRAQKVLVFAADGASVTPELLAHVGAAPDRLIVQDLGERAAFAPIRWGATELDNGALIDDLVALARAQVEQHPQIAAILLECSDLPPYAADIHDATGLPVFDFVTLIEWVHHAVTQRRYYGDM